MSNVPGVSQSAAGKLSLTPAESARLDETQKQPTFQDQIAKNSNTLDELQKSATEQKNKQKKSKEKAGQCIESNIDKNPDYNRELEFMLKKSNSTVVYLQKTHLFKNLSLMQLKEFNLFNVKKSNKNRLKSADFSTKYKISGILFADDAAILVESAYVIQKSFNVLTEWCKRWDINVNSKKIRYYDNQLFN
ncbi:hypothetical protein BB561_000860 [Smittium simulii]|uniref:Reverse transcriptase domain-containing protein n=1 Tax=Smittium simulii TaxID=133385 RepID=A0A2T9YX83_9FUNG|nr:hypothetical protein BB561_000860 [Smittium simulii]